MAAEGLEHHSKDDLIHELINRQTFFGVVIYHRSDVKDGRMEPGQFVLTKSPPLTREHVEEVLRLGGTLVPQMFGKTTEDTPLKSLDPPTLRQDPDGSLRIGTSRITLDLIVEQYECGMSPEEMVRAYDTLKLADVYSAIGFYLGNRERIQEYLDRRHEQAAALREKIERERPRISRAELLTRQAARESVDAAAGQ